MKGDEMRLSHVDRVMIVSSVNLIDNVLRDQNDNLSDLNVNLFIVIIIIVIMTDSCNVQ